MIRESVVVLIGAAGLAGSASAGPIINEYVANHTGSDDMEFVEVFADPGMDLSGLTLLQIEGDSSSSGFGSIDSAITLSTADANGFWTTGFLTNEIENGTQTLLLVDGFTGVKGGDLDTDNDGIIDVALPWTSILDSIGVNDGGSGDTDYGLADTVLFAGFDGGSFTVGGASRIPNGVDTDSIADWMRNDFNKAGYPGFPLDTLDPGEALNTPGTFNAVPSPGSLTLLGVAGLALVRRRR